MMLKTCLMLLGALLIVQNCYAAPAPEKSEETVNNPFKDVIERFKLLELTLDQVLELHKIIIDQGKIVFKKVLEDPKIIEIKNNESVEKIRKFVDLIEKDTSEAKTFELLDEFGEIAEKFKDDAENLSAEEEIIEKSLKEHGFEDFRSIIIANFKTFIEKFTKELDGYIAKLNDEEKKEEEKLINWFAKLKAEEDVEKQFDLLDTLFSEIGADSSSESAE